MIDIVRRPRQKPIHVKLPRKGAHVTRREVVHSTENYSELVAARLRELRRSRRWTIEEFIDHLADVGGVVNITTYRGECPPDQIVDVVYSDGIKGKMRKVPPSTVRSWERGKINKGADIPTDYYPLIAMVYGYTSPVAWLPDSMPD